MAESDGCARLFSWPPNCGAPTATSLSREISARRLWGTLLSMTFIVAAVLGGFAFLVLAIAALLVQRTRRSRTERELREREERLRLIVEQTPAMVWTMRPNSTLDFLNRTCMTFSGLPIEKLLDDGWLDSVHPDDRDRCVGIYVPAVEARRPFLAEYRMRHADGSYRWLLATGVPRYEADGSFSGYIGCDVDITERKNAEDQIQYLAGRLIGAQEVERARIARDLHDDVSQQLAGVSIAFSGLKQRLGEYHVSEELRQELVELQQQTLKLARNVRQLSHDLHPAVLQHLGLVKGLTSILRRTRACTRCDDDVHCGGRFWRHHAGRCAVRLPNRAGSPAERHRTRRRQPRGCEAAPDP